MSGNDGRKENGRDERTDDMSGALDRDAFLGGLRRMGWRSAFLEDGKALEAQLDGADVAGSLMAAWRKDPTLDNFARQLNGGSAIFSDDNRLRRFVAAMNLAYIQAKNELPATLTDSYLELLFWDGCDMPEARAHFERIGVRFAEQSSAHGIVGAELGELLQSRDLSPQMKEVRRVAVDKLRETLRGQIAMERVPNERLRAVLGAATGIGGARVVNETIWEMAQQSVKQGAKASPDAYLALRDMLNQAAEGPMLDQPRETLNRITQITAELDAEAQYGLPFDAARMLQYWRSLSFHGIPDDKLKALYEKYLRTNPNGLPLLQQDRPMLTDREDESLQALLDGKRNVSRDEGGRRDDGFGERTPREGGFLHFDQRKLMYIGLGALVVALMALLAFVLPKGDDGDKAPSPTPVATPIAAPEPTEEEAPEPTREPTSKPTREPEETPTPEPTVEATPSPTIEPTPTPTSTPAPTRQPTQAPQTPAPTQKPAPTPNAAVPTIPPTEEPADLPAEEAPLNEDDEIIEDIPAEGDGIIEE